MRHRRRPAAPIRGGRALAVLATFVVVFGGLAGCARPAGVDAVLTDDWLPMGAPSGFTPAAGTCHAASFTDVGFRAAYEVVDCATRHRTETAHVGTFTGPVAAASTPPAKGSPGAKDAYRQCDTKAAEYVGADWRTARLWLGVVQPSPAAWSGGAKWFRCDLIEVSSVEDDGDVVPRVGSLRDTLKRPSSPLKLACYAVEVDANGGIDTMPPASCTKPHNAEFVGLWTTGEVPYPRTGADWEKFHDGCRAIIADYVGVPNDKDLEFRTGVVSLPGGEDVWQDGDRGVRCYLWLDGAKLKSTLKGRGVKALPIQFK
jgi:Septum formation